MGLIAGVDSSTQSTKVVLHDQDDFAVVGRGAAPHPPTFPPVSEQDPERWWTALGQTLFTALENAAAAPTDIRAISVAAQCHGLVALDRGGAVVRPAKLWNDTTSAPQMTRLLEQLPATEWARRTGSVPTAAFTISKLAWLRAHEPENFARTATVLLPHDWLTYRLTGETATDRSEASGTGYFDAARNSYDHELLAMVDPDVDWDPMLPTVLGPSTAAGTVSNAAAEALGLRRDTVVGPGAGDQHASALGLGTRPGDLVYVLGTSGVVFTTSTTPTHDPTGTVDGVADAAGGYLPLVSTLNAAKVTDTFARLLGVDHAEFARLGGHRHPDRDHHRHHPRAGCPRSRRRCPVRTAARCEGAVRGGRGHHRSCHCHRRGVAVPGLPAAARRRHRRHRPRLHLHRGGRRWRRTSSSRVFDRRRRPRSARHQRGTPRP